MPSHWLRLFCGWGKNGSDNAADVTGGGGERGRRRVGASHPLGCLLEYQPECARGWFNPCLRNEQEETMKQTILLFFAFVCFGYTDAESGQTYEDSFRDFMGLLERDSTPEVNGGSVKGTSRNTVREANDFIDVVLLQRMPELVRATPGLYPVARLPPFKFKVYKTAITNRDLKVNVTEGDFKNFDTAVHRVGDCNRMLVAGNTSITCTFKFDGIAADLAAVTKGDSLLGVVKRVYVEAVVYNTTGRFDVTAAQNRPGYVRTFYVEHVHFDIKVSNNLDLNRVRMCNFKSFITEKLTEEFYMNLYGNYRTLLNYACARVNMSLN
ncbi:salivary anticoagulant protein P23-like [Haemaphysalis longicornis]